MDNLSEAGSINFALSYVRQAQEDLMKAIMCLSSTREVRDFSFARICILSELGNTLNEMQEEMEAEVEISAKEAGELGHPN